MSRPTRSRQLARLTALLALTAAGLLGGGLAAQAASTGTSATSSASGSLGDLSATISTTYQCVDQSGPAMGGDVTATVTNSGTTAQDVTLKTWADSPTGGYPYAPLVVTVPAGSSADLSHGYSMYSSVGGFILTSGDGTIATLEIHCTPSSPLPSPTETTSPEPSPTPTDTTPMTPQPESTPAALSPAASLSTSTIAPDGQVAVTGSGYAAGEPIELWLHSTPVKLSTLTAAADGTFTQTVTIPAGTELGSHQIEVRGTTSGSLSLSLTVTQGLAVTGVDSAAVTGIGIGAGVLVFGGAVILIATTIRRRRSA